MGLSQFQNLQKQFNIYNFCIFVGKMFGSLLAYSYLCTSE